MIRWCRLGADCLRCHGGGHLLGRVAGEEADPGAGEDVEAEVTAAFGPLVVLLGEDGADEPDEDDELQELLSALPDPELMRLAGEGHTLPLTDPEIVADHVARWFRHSTSPAMLIRLGEKASPSPGPERPIRAAGGDDGKAEMSASSKVRRRIFDLAALVAAASAV